MANAVRIQPDLQFVKDLQAVGGDSLKKCYQCATCSVVCNLSPADAPYPRKEMVWAQWGLKDKLMSDIDIWLCHNCQDCSEKCPRGARPGDILAALRNMTYRSLVEPTVVGTWMSSPKYLPILAGIPAVLYLLIWMLTQGGLSLPEGEIVYGKLFPGDYTIDPIFGLLALFVAFTFYRGVSKLIALFDAQPKTLVLGQKKRTFVECLVDTLVNEVGQHSKFQCCDTATKERFKGHLLTFYAFVALGIVTSAVAIGHWGGKVLHFLEPMGHTPMALYNPIKILANVGAIMLVTGLTLLTKKRLNADPERNKSSYYDWYLIGVIWAIALTGIFSELLRLAGVATLAYPMYYLHLIAVFMMIAYLPWSKLGHLVYRTTALAYARYIGRVPMP